MLLCNFLCGEKLPPVSQCKALYKTPTQTATHTINTPKGALLRSLEGSTKIRRIGNGLCLSSMSASTTRQLKRPRNQQMHLACDSDIMRQSHGVADVSLCVCVPAPVCAYIFKERVLGVVRDYVNQSKSEN